MSKNFDDYVGRLTQEEAAELLSVCIRDIPLEKVIAEILKLGRVDLEELEASIEIHLTEQNYLKNTPLENELEP